MVKMSNKRRGFTLQGIRLIEKCYDREQKNGRNGIYVNVGEINLSSTRKMKIKNQLNIKCQSLIYYFQNG